MVQYDVFLFVAALGSMIVIEFIIMLFLGSILLFFICRCVLLLRNERKRIYTKDSKLGTVEKSPKPSVSALQ